MQEHTVFVVENEHALRAIAPHIARRFSSSVYAITTRYLGLYEFRYRRGLSMGDFPIIGDPNWKPRQRPLPIVFEVSTSHFLPAGLEPSGLLSSAAQIWFAADPDPAGAVAFHVLLSETLGAAAAYATHPALHLHGLGEHSVSNAFDSPATTSDSWFNAARNAGIARRFFDFNFNVNALALFGPGLRKSNPSSDSYLVSKYSLQLLYALRETAPWRNDRELLQKMETWEGTGRYAACSMGSPASRPEILKGLRTAGLLDGVALSAQGKAFLDLLHPECCDQDLPGRMSLWEQEWPASRPKIERYLRTFFGKQKRFAPGHVTSM